MYKIQHDFFRFCLIEIDVEAICRNNVIVQRLHTRLTLAIVALIVVKLGKVVEHQTLQYNAAFVTVAFLASKHLQNQFV